MVIYNKKRQPTEKRAAAFGVEAVEKPTELHLTWAF